MSRLFEPRLWRGFWFLYYVLQHFSAGCVQFECNAVAPGFEKVADKCSEVLLWDAVRCCEMWMVGKIRSSDWKRRQKQLPQPIRKHAKTHLGVCPARDDGERCFTDTKRYCCMPGSGRIFFSFRSVTWKAYTMFSESSSVPISWSGKRAKHRAKTFRVFAARYPPKSLPAQNPSIKIKICYATLLSTHGYTYMAALFISGHYASCRDLTTLTFPPLLPLHYWPSYRGSTHHSLGIYRGTSSPL